MMVLAPSSILARRRIGSFLPPILTPVDGVPILHIPFLLLFHHVSTSSIFLATIFFTLQFSTRRHRGALHIHDHLFTFFS